MLSLVIDTVLPLIKVFKANGVLNKFTWVIICAISPSVKGQSLRTSCSLLLSNSCLWWVCIFWICAEVLLIYYICVELVPLLSNTKYSRFFIFLCQSIASGLPKKYTQPSKISSLPLLERILRYCYVVCGSLHILLW